MININHFCVTNIWANQVEVKKELKIDIQTDSMESLIGKFDAIILGVAHKEFSKIDVRSFLNSPNGVVYDVKGVLAEGEFDVRL